MRSRIQIEPPVHDVFVDGPGGVVEGEKITDGAAIRLPLDRGGFGLDDVDVTDGDFIGFAGAAFFEPLPDPPGVTGQLQRQAHLPGIGLAGAGLDLQGAQEAVRLIHEIDDADQGYRQGVAVFEIDEGNGKIPFDLQGIEGDVPDEQLRLPEGFRPRRFHILPVLRRLFFLYVLRPEAVENALGVDELFFLPGQVMGRDEAVG